MITEQNYPAFKARYLKAVETHEEVFQFESQDVLTAYARHLCEYVDGSAKCGL